MRIGSRFLILIGALLLLGACAQANRVVDATRSAERPNGETLYTVSWRSDLYAAQAVSHRTLERDGFVRDGFVRGCFVRGCFERAVVGEPLPSDCLTREALFNETGTFSRNPLATLGISLLALAGLLYFSMRRIGAIPSSEALATASPGPTGAGTRAGQRAAPDPAVSLMQSAGAQKDAYAQEWEARQHLARPGQGRRYVALGLSIGIAFVIAAGLLVGFIAGGELGFVTALVIYLGVAVIYVFSLTSLLATGTHREALYQRLALFSGAATGMLLGGLLGSLLLAPQIEWDGVRWLF